MHKIAGTGSPAVVVANMLNCGIAVSEFELKSRYYIQLGTSNIGKSMNPLIPPAVG